MLDVISNIFNDYGVHIIQWIILIAGWKVVSNDNNSREQRKEIRSLLNTTTDLILEIQRDAFNYFTSQPNTTDSSILELSIAEKLDRLEKSIDIIAKQKKTFEDKSQFIKFKQKITLSSNFGSINRTPIGTRDRYLLEVSIEAKNLALQLDTKFIESYN